MSGFDFEKADSDLPRDRLLAFLFRHPRLANLCFFGVLLGAPFLCGVGVGIAIAP